MFGQVINNAPQIIEGHLNEVMNKESELSEERLAICAECPLFTDSKIGYVCDARKCLNTETNELVKLPGKNIICGCGCRLLAKTRLKNAKCVLGKW